MRKQTVYTADRIFDGSRTLTGHGVVVRGSKVVAVAPLESLAPELRVIHSPGCTLLPGLIDIHTHFMRWQAPLFLAHGVTTIRDTGNRLEWILDRRDEASGRGWPRILATGPLLDGPTPVHPLVSRRCLDLESSVAAVDEMVVARVDGIKLYVGLAPDWIPGMAREAHLAGLKASMHSAGGVLAAGGAGLDEFFHLDGLLPDIWPDHPPAWLDAWGLPGFADTWEQQQRVADGIAELGLAATPTLAYWESHSGEPVPGAAPPGALAQWIPGRDPEEADRDRWRRALEAAQRFVGLLIERDAPVLAGSDIPCGSLVPGASLWRELSLLVEAGMSAEQALRTATADAGAFLGKPGLGRIAPGSPADLVAVAGDPTLRIPDPPEVTLVVRAGVAHTPADLLAEAPEAAEGYEEDPWSVQFKAHWDAGSRKYAQEAEG